MGPTNTLRKEKVEISNPVWHSGQNRATFPEITRISVACVTVVINEIFLQIMNALEMGFVSQVMVDLPKCAWILSWKEVKHENVTKIPFFTFSCS